MDLSGTSEPALSAWANEGAASAVLDLGGRWCCVEALRGRAYLAGLGALETWTRIRSDLHVVQRGAEVDVTWQVEAIEIESGTGLTRIEVDPASIAALPPTRRMGRIERGVGTQARLLLPPVTLEQRLRLRFRGLLRGTQTVVQRTTTAFVSAPLVGAAISGNIDWEATRVVESTSNPLLRLAPAVAAVKGASTATWTRRRPT